MNVGRAIEGLYYAFVYALVIAVGAAVILAIYVLWQAFFSLTPWDVCVRMETDAAKVQCMEAHYD